MNNNTTRKDINICMNRRNFPRLSLEICKVGVSVGHKLCTKKVGRIVRCGIARELLSELILAEVKEG